MLFQSSRSKQQATKRNQPQPGPIGPVLVSTSLFLETNLFPLFIPINQKPIFNLLFGILIFRNDFFAPSWCFCFQAQQNHQPLPRLGCSFLFFPKSVPWDFVLLCLLFMFILSTASSGPSIWTGLFSWPFLASPTLCKCLLSSVPCKPF